MNVRRITQVIMLATVVLLGAWNIYAVAAGGSEATISRNMYGFVQRWPILAVAIGVLIGHWFWPLRVREKSR